MTIKHQKNEQSPMNPAKCNLQPATRHVKASQGWSSLVKPKKEGGCPIPPFPHATFPSFHHSIISNAFFL